MSTKFYVIVGLGPNNIEISALVFSNWKKADQMCSRLNSKIENLEPYDKQYEVLEGLAYTYYYGGCGDCFQFEVREVNEGKPFAKWDLD